MKMARISDQLADRLDAISDQMANEIGVRSLSREQVISILLEESLRTREGTGDEAPAAAEG